MVIIVGIVIIILAIRLPNKKEELKTNDDSKIVYVVLNSEPQVVGNFSLDFSWYDYGDKLTEKNVIPYSSIDWNDISTGGKFIIVVVNYDNVGRERAAIDISDFSLIDSQQRIYKPSYLTHSGISILDKDKFKIDILSPDAKGYLDVNESGITHKIGILFEVAKDTNPVNLRMGVENLKAEDYLP